MSDFLKYKNMNFFKFLSFPKINIDNASISILIQERKMIFFHFIINHKFRILFRYFKFLLNLLKIAIIRSLQITQYFINPDSS